MLPSLWQQKCWCKKPGHTASVCGCSSYLASVRITFLVAQVITANVVLLQKFQAYHDFELQPLVL